MANIYDKAVVKVQKKSGFDKSFQNLFTSKVGTITPVLVDELIPNTTVNLKSFLKQSKFDLLFDIIPKFLN